MSRGLIFDLQRYAVHDGPGIRTLVFLKGCPLRCAWCCNPESQQARPELMRASGAPADADVPAWAGREADAREVLAEIEQDRDFYRNSGGGATFSGGEPFFQPDFLGELLAGCRERGIGTAVETCGHAPDDVMLDLEPLIGLFLFDMKVLDPRRHLRFTGQDNSLIMKSFRRLADRCPKKLMPRLTVIPGISDTPENLSAMAELLRESRLGSIELIAYHPLGLSKWERLGRVPPLPPDPGLVGGAVAKAMDFFTQKGFSCALP